MSDEREPYAWAVSGSIWLYDEYEAEAKAKRWGGTAEAFPLYRQGAPEGWQLVPIKPTPEMVEASRGVKRQRMLVAAGMLKQGKRPDTISMSLATDEEWAAMIAAAPSAQKEG